MLNATQTTIHEKAVRLARNHRALEAKILAVLREVEKHKVHRSLGISSLFVYATTSLGLTESVAYAFISVMRKSLEVPRLAHAIKEGDLSVAKASRILKGLTDETADHLISFAKTHTTREAEIEAARLEGGERPKGQRKIEVSLKTLELLRRLQDLLPHKDRDQALQSALEEYLHRHDPLEKARRAEKKRQANSERSRIFNEAPKKELTKKELTGKLRESPANPGAAAQRDGAKTREETAEVASQQRRRKAISAKVMHAVKLRDGGRCTFVDALGRRCENRRYLHLHHRVPYSLGGQDTVDNLQCVCSHHHQLIHQPSFTSPVSPAQFLGPSFAVDGQINWIRGGV